MKIKPGVSLIFAFFVVLISNSLSMYLPSQLEDGFPMFIGKMVVSFCDGLIICLQIFALMYSRSEYEIKSIGEMWAKDREAYRLKKEEMDSLNVKIHDVRHLLRSMDYSKISQEIKVIDDSITQYDTIIYTGNKALDVAINEKLDYCKRHNIEFTVIADGEGLSFIKDTDIYTLFGNILENAIDSVSKFDELGKRVISLKIDSDERGIHIRQDNFYTGTIQVKNGWPLTTKPHREDHGFGMKSIGLLVEKYDGTYAFSFENGIFYLEINIPKEC